MSFHPVVDELTMKPIRRSPHSDCSPHETLSGTIDGDIQNARGATIGRICRPDNRPRYSGGRIRTPRQVFEHSPHDDRCSIRGDKRAPSGDLQLDTPQNRRYMSPMAWNREDAWIHKDAVAPTIAYGTPRFIRWCRRPRQYSKGLQCRSAHSEGVLSEATRGDSKA